MVWNDIGGYFEVSSIHLVKQEAYSYLPIGTMIRNDWLFVKCLFFIYAVGSRRRTASVPAERLSVDSSSKPLGIGLTTPIYSMWILGQIF